VSKIPQSVEVRVARWRITRILKPFIRICVRKLANNPTIRVGKAEHGEFRKSLCLGEELGNAVTERLCHFMLRNAVENKHGLQREFNAPKIKEHARDYH